MTAALSTAPIVRFLERTGRGVIRGIEEFGLGAAYLGTSACWLMLGRRRHQPVRAASIVQQMMDIGVRAVPIVGVLAATIGVMLAIQGIYTLRTFGAESRVTIGIALSMTREFAPLITGIVVAGRSGSALAARVGTMTINQEIDALRVMGIDPVRYLVAPAVIGCMIMVPALTILANGLGLWAAGVYVGMELGVGIVAFAAELATILTPADILHGLYKSVLFGVLIALIGVVNGALVSGGAEGVGRCTTRAVVQCIAALVITDMLFVFVMSR